MLRSSILGKETGRVAKRLYSTQVVRQEQSSKVHTRKLRNGLTVVTAEADSLHANVSLVVNAGSRFEDPSANLGVTHCLRAAPCLTSDQNTAFQSTQAIGSLGGSIGVSGTREHIGYNLRCGRRVWRELLTEAVVPNLLNSRFYWWELQDISKSMKNQLAEARSDMNYRLVEALHKASFRGGLANSVLSPDSMIGSHSTDMVQAYFDSKYTLSNMVLAGTGVSHDELCDVGESFTLDSGTRAGAPKSDFVSSEVREHEVGQPTCVGIGFSGVALNDQDAISLAILQHVLGGTVRVKRQSGLVSRLTSAVAKKVDQPFVTSAFNVNYSDGGLLGIYMKSNPTLIGNVVGAVREEIAAMASGKITDAEVNAGKQSLKADVLMQSENSQALLDDLAVQTSVLNGYISPEEISSKIDAVTTSQVSRVAKKVLGSRKSLAALGDLTHCPYLSDL